MERLVNEAIKAGVPVVCEEMPLEEAKKSGAIGLLKTNTPRWSRCTPWAISQGNMRRTACLNTAELGSFKIKKEESSSAGVRRIKAVIGQQ